MGHTIRPIAGARRKTVLAMLALHAGQVVSVDRLVDVVWGDTAPATAVNTLQSHVSLLRRALARPEVIVAQPPGYLLNLGCCEVDVELAEELIRRAASAEPAVALPLLRDALHLWRGRALTDLTNTPWLEEQAGRLDQLRLTAQHALVDARLALGQHIQLLPELHQLTRGNPYHEHLHASLMLALYRAGRPTDALAVYRRLKDALQTELGVDPGPPLRELRAAILRRDPSLDLASGAVTADATPVSVAATEEFTAIPAPAQLPPPNPNFAGRTAELFLLDKWLYATASSGAHIVAVSGTAGVGKTALAVYWSHRVSDRFPDGQLYLNLRGFDASAAMLAPADALIGCLVSLGIRPERVPPALDEMTNLYRTMLSGKRMLLLLDNARNTDQVRPLLPATAGCVAVVTSRDQLTALVAGAGARLLNLQRPDVEQARAILSGYLGSERIQSQPKETSEVIACCARLPLALVVAAAWAAARPGFPLAALVSELRSTALDGLSAGDRSTDVRSVLSWSYRLLGPVAAGLFRLLGLVPGPDIGVAAVASLAGIGLRETRLALQELIAAQLITEAKPGRYSWHDLLGAFAAERARIDLDEGVRREAMCRLLDHYARSAHAAARQLGDRLGGEDPLPERAGVVPEQPRDEAAGLAWFTAEHETLLGLVRQARVAGFIEYLWPLGRAMRSYLRMSGHLRDASTVHRTVLEAVTAEGDLARQAFTLRSIAEVEGRLGESAAASRYLLRSLALSRQLQDHTAQGHALMSLGLVAEQSGQYAEMLARNQEALAQYRLAGEPAGIADAHGAVGWAFTLNGDYGAALVYCHEAAHLQRIINHRAGLAGTLDSLGVILCRLGRLTESAQRLEEALDLCRQMGDRFHEAMVLDHLGDTRLARGDVQGAIQPWRHALALMRELDHPDLGRLDRKLSAVSSDTDDD